MPQYEIQQVAPDSQAAVTKYHADLLSAFATAETPWSTQYGMTKIVDGQTLEARFPIDMYSTVFQAFKGNSKYESISQKVVKIQMQAWQAGVDASWAELKANGGFSRAPNLLANSAAEAPNDWVTTAIEANAVCDYDGLSFFNDSHLVNPFKASSGTFDNSLTSTTFVEATAMSTLATLEDTFAGFKHPDNKKSLGLKLTHIMVPVTKASLSRRVSGAATFYNGTALVDNPYFGIGVIVNPRLTGTSIYGLALNLPGVAPWGVVLGGGGSPEVHTFDEGSEYYKETMRVKVNSFLHGACEMLAPHCMIKVAP